VSYALSGKEQNGGTKTISLMFPGFLVSSE
jgi:hypothetical protein